MAHTRIRSKKTRTQHVVETSMGEMVVELHASCLTMRPLRSRNGDAEVALNYGALYTRALLERPNKKRRRR